MNFAEHAAKPLLAAAGIAIPDSRLVDNVADAGHAAKVLGPVMIKAQVPTGKRGKAGGIQPAENAQTAAAAAERILGMNIGGHIVTQLLIEQQASIQQEYYAAILNDANSQSPRLLFSAQGGWTLKTSPLSIRISSCNWPSIFARRHTKTRS